MSKDNKAKKTKKRYRSLEKKTALWGLIFLLPWLIGLVFSVSYTHLTLPTNREV